jgi:hypothetical protein
MTRYEAFVAALEAMKPVQHQEALAIHERIYGAGPSEEEVERMCKAYEEVNGTPFGIYEGMKAALMTVFGGRGK